MSLERIQESEMSEQPVLKRIWISAIFSTIIFLFTTDDVLISILGRLVIFGLALLYIPLFTKFKIKATYALILTLICAVLILIPYNYLYIGLDKTMDYKFVMSNTYTLEAGLVLLAGYGILTLFALAAVIITYYYLKSKRISIRSASSGDAVSSMFDYFITDTNWRKIMVLGALLFIAALVEEILYRYFLVNILFLFNVPIWLIIIVGAIAFGYAHEGNGFIIYVFNSTLAGIIFVSVFLYGGMMLSLGLHLMWNVLVVVERKIDILISGG